MRNSEFV